MLTIINMKGTLAVCETDGEQILGVVFSFPPGTTNKEACGKFDEMRAAIFLFDNIVQSSDDCRACVSVVNFLRRYTDMAD